MKTTLVLSALSAALILPLSARAGSQPPPAMANSYRTECGSCHVAYPPDLMSVGGWRTIMASLDAHFGENAALEEPVRREIEHYLTEHGATSEHRFGSRTDPARLTTTRWFRRTHGQVKSFFANALVGSAAHCSACHPQAEQGRYAREGVILPQLPR